MSLRYLSVCSGIEAATVAWAALGWQAVAFSEIEKFPSALLAHYYPDVPNLGDMRNINGKDFCGKIDVLVGGTPERGNLALEFVRIADEAAPAFIVWENVPGVLSDTGNAFGCFLGALAGENAPLEPPGGKWTDAGYVLGPGRAIAWRVLDAQYFGLAQRRKRVFLVACPGNGADPRKVLFEFDGLRRDTAPGREAGADVAGSVKASFGGRGFPQDAEAAAGGYFQPVAQPLCFGGESSRERDISTALGAHDRRTWEQDTFVAYPLRAQAQSAHDESLEAYVTHALRGEGSDIRSNVRRLTPRECARLQGFPDDYTAIPGASDSASYKALGNAMAVHVMRWIGERIPKAPAHMHQGFGTKAYHVD
jgi:DNA (cytosine-5)-methyltransferase 1